MYFIKVDVRCAFDSIDQAKLLEIIEQILRKGEDEQTEGYRIHRFAKIMPSAVHDSRSAAKHPSADPSAANGLIPKSTPILNSDGETIWKVLVFDNLGRDVISSVLRVNDLRGWGITIHLYVQTLCWRKLGLSQWMLRP